MPANPFFSDRNHSRNFGTRRIYPHVQIINITKTMSPSNEYAKQKDTLQISSLEIKTYH